MRQSNDNKTECDERISWRGIFKPPFDASLGRSMTDGTWDMCVEQRGQAFLVETSEREFPIIF